MAHELWCGKLCHECKTRCALAEHTLCSPDCKNLAPDGTMDTAACEKAKCDAYKKGKNYGVTIVRTGYVAVRAKSPEDARWIADHIRTDAVSWSDDWGPTEVERDPGLSDDECITMPTAMFL